MIKVPKRVAGVKIPKAVRKGPVLQFVNSAAGKLLLAEAISAALGAIAYKHGKSGKLEDVVGDARDRLNHSAARLSHAFAAGVRAFREALGEDPDDTGRDADSGLDDEGPSASKKSFRRSSAAPPSPG
ncbi:MAG TPA: hypothetical protein VM146_02470 [Steroidobacteraceae bacterium]|nr:hypothetical protein [Steroidobacteraceae bacterium]